MEFLSWIFSNVLPFLVILTILVFVHEMGHYLIARRNGVKVEVFSVGFGPELFGWNDKSGTRWKFSSIPLGGYVKMFGDANAASMPGEGVEEMSEADKAVAFHHKRLGQRVWIVAGGPLANYIFAIILMTGLIATYGQMVVEPVVGGVLPDSAAERAGVVLDDRIVAIDSVAVESFEDIQRIVEASADQALSVTLMRAGEAVTVQISPELVAVKDVFGNEHKIGRLGIQGTAGERTHLSLPESLWAGTKQTFSLTGQILVGTYEIIIGIRSARELGGPLRIAKMSGQAAEEGLAFTIWFMALLSINLGLINLFPIPMLDGGHLLYYAIEWVRGRPLGDRAQEYGFRIGLTLVMSLVLFVTWNDLIHIRVVDFVKSLVG